MNDRELKSRFLQEYGSGEGIRMFFAPGRVNLIGEHTDYNGGYVFPAALTLGTWALVRPREDGLYRFRSTNFERKAECHIGKVEYREEDDWANYPKGVLKEWLRFSDLAAHLKGADILYHGNILNGAGLSSSASIEMVTALALMKLAGADIPMLELVKLAQRAENRFIGVNCGIMDPFAVGMGRKDHAMMLKCESLEYRYVPVHIDGYKLVITNTNKRRGLANSKYNERRRECEEGLRYIQQRLPHVHRLGDLTPGEWESVKDEMPDQVIRRRVDHVVSETKRVLLAAESLQQHDLQAFGQWMKQSHESLRDQYQVTGVELDTLFEEARRIPGCIGTRMTGAGFGGCHISLVKEEAVKRFQKEVADRYTRKTGLIPTFHICDIGDGTREMTGEVEA
ncbi:galactokinase [Paludifilum halophilum]|uniref:Galactokinase n=1 Tax=Paludifilum halophilum TaxID=1642702 RepID=A0A235BBW7_9BACL|nr:galactokinase [Paludifilum halophilum]OYD09790.1 galactokinase [Paludifilum halophilum]